MSLSINYPRLNKLLASYLLIIFVSILLIILLIFLEKKLNILVLFIVLLALLIPILLEPILIINSDFIVIKNWFSYFLGIPTNRKLPLNLLDTITIVQVNNGIKTVGIKFSDSDTIKERIPKSFQLHIPNNGRLIIFKFINREELSKQLDNALKLYTKS